LYHAALNIEGGNNMTETAATVVRRQPNKSEITAARLQFIKILAGRKRKFNAPSLQKLGAVHNFDKQTALSWIHILAKARICKRINHRQWIMMPGSRDQQIAQMSKALGVAEFTTLAETPAEIRRKLIAERQAINEPVRIEKTDKKSAALNRLKDFAGFREKARRYDKLVATVGLDLINDLLGE
jgi:hypothetical protein